MFNKINYDLPVTDPQWLAEIESLAEGEYTSEKVIELKNLENNYDPHGFLLTISLGEPFQPTENIPKRCYKLVAAVMNAKAIKNFYNLS